MARARSEAVGFILSGVLVAGVGAVGMVTISSRLSSGQYSGPDWLVELALLLAVFVAAAVLFMMGRMRWTR